MSRSHSRSVILLTILALVVSACGSIDTVETYCDSLTVHYTITSPPVNYSFAAYLADGTKVSDDVSGTANASGTQTIPLHREYPAGTLLYVAGTGNGIPRRTPDAACQNTETGANEGGEIIVTWFEPGDDRINRQAYASAAVYCDTDNSRVAIYGIDADGVGFPAIFVPYADLPDTPSGQDGHRLISQFENVSFYRLTTGEYQVNAGPDSEGKSYVAIWDGCPQSYLNAYTLQNGVMTPAELNPAP